MKITEDKTFIDALKKWQGDNLISDQVFNKIINAIKFNDAVLDLSGLQLKTLPPFELMGDEFINNLKELNLSNNDISDFNVLRSLNKLENLNLSGNKPGDLYFLSSLNKLKKLDLSNCKISGKLIPLMQLKELEELDLSRNLLKNSSLRPIDDLTKLTKLNLSGNDVEDPIKFERIKEIPLVIKDDINQLLDDWIETQPNKVFLKLLGIKERIIESRKNPDQILVLSHLQLTSIPPYQCLRGIKKIDLSNNQIKSVDQLNHLTSLTSLDLSQNQIEEIGKLNRLTSLEDLNLSANKLQDINGINGLNLKSLRLDSNQIKDASCLSSLKSLNELKLQYNPIENIGEFRSHPNFIKIFEAEFDLWIKYSGCDPLHISKLNSIKKEIVDKLRKQDEIIIKVKEYYPSHIEKIGSSSLSNKIRSIMDLQRDDQEQSIIMRSEIEYSLGFYKRFEKDLVILGDLINANEYFKTNFFKFSNLGLKQIPPLFYLPEITSLDLSNNDIKDLSQLKGSKDLSFLNLDLNPTLKDVSVLEDLKNLKKLIIPRELESIGKIPEKIKKLAKPDTFISPSYRYASGYSFSSRPSSAPYLPASLYDKVKMSKSKSSAPRIAESLSINANGQSKFVQSKILLTR